MSWVSAFVAFTVAHMVGDYLLQTDWQASHKFRGLGRDPEARRALLSHIATYTLAFVPALVWVGREQGAGLAVIAGVLIALPHLIIDDGRLVRGYVDRVKHARDPQPGLLTSVDQSFHVVSLFLVALLAGPA